MLLINLYTIVIGLNIHGSISVNFFKLEAEDFSNFVSSCFMLTVLVFILVLTLNVFLSEQISNFLKIPQSMLYISSVVGFFNVFFLCCLAILQSSNNAFTFFKLKFTQSLSDLLASVALIVVLLAGLNGRIISFSVAIVLCAVLSIAILCKRGYIGLSVSKEFAQKALGFGLPLLPHALAGCAIMFVDRIIITHLIDLHAVGVYMAALQVSMVMLFVIEPINKAYSPWLFKALSAEDVEIIKPKIVKMSYFYFLFLIVVAFVLYLLSDFVFYLMIDEKFYSAKKSMLFLLMGFAFQGMYYTVTNFMFFKEKTGVLSCVTLFSAISGGGLSYFLVGIYGVVGASVAFMLSNLLTFLLVWCVSGKYVKMPWFSYISWGKR